MKEILYPWKNFIKESLAKDIERHQLASEFFNIIIENLKSAKKQEGSDYTYDSEIVAVMPMLDRSEGKLVWEGNKLFAGFYSLPEHLKKLFIGVELPKEKQEGEEQEQVSKVKQGYLSIMLVPYSDNFGASGVYNLPKLNHRDEFKPEIWIFNCKGYSSLKNIKKDTLGILQDKKSTIIHEIAHLIDDASLMGHKSFRHKTEKSEEEKEEYLKKGYYNIGLEVNARWVEIFNWLNGRQYSDYKNLDNDLAERFEYWLSYAKRIMHFSKMSPPKQRKFISRFYEFYENGPYKTPDNIIDFEVNRLVDQHKKYMENVLLYADIDKITYKEFYNRLWWNEDSLSTEELWNYKVIMRYFYPLGHRPYPYSSENSKIIVDKARNILMPLIEKFAAKHKSKFK